MDLIFSTIVTTLSSSILIGIFSLWLKARLENSILYEYNKKLEDYKNDIDKRNKAEQISELLSEWLSYPEKQKELNKLSINLFLWLPDNLAIDLSSLLSHSTTPSVDIRDFIFNIRKYLNKDTKLDKDNIILFTRDTYIAKIKTELKKANKSMKDSDIEKISSIGLSPKDINLVIDTFNKH